jgi:hypothetical protein
MATFNAVGKLAGGSSTGMAYDPDFLFFAGSLNSKLNWLSFAALSRCICSWLSNQRFPWRLMLTRELWRSTRFGVETRVCRGCPANSQARLSSGLCASAFCPFAVLLNQPEWCRRTTERGPPCLQPRAFFSQRLPLSLSLPITRLRCKGRDPPIQTKLSANARAVSQTMGP